MLVDFQASFRLAWLMSRCSDFVRMMSRQTDSSRPGFLSFSGRPKTQKARQVIGRTLLSTLVGIGAKTHMEDRFYTILLTDGSGSPERWFQKDLLDAFQMTDHWLSRRLLHGLCQEMIAWLKSRPHGRVRTDARCPLEEVRLLPNGSLAFRARKYIELDDWAKTPPTAAVVSLGDPEKL